MESYRKKTQRGILEIKSHLNQIKNTTESHSSRMEQGENRISGHEDKTDITNRRMLNKRHKSCKRNIHELCDSIKRPNL
jgi:hypothetical protein